jgi:hypothetical protein
MGLLHAFVLVLTTNFGEREGLMRLHEAADVECMHVPPLSVPQGAILARVHSGAVFCPVNANQTGGRVITVVFDPKRCGNADSGVRAKWFAPYIFPNYRTQLISLAEIQMVSESASGASRNGSMAKVWVWKKGRSTVPFPGGAPDFIVGDYFSLSKMGVDTTTIQTANLDKTLSNARLHAKQQLGVSNGQWDNGMYFPLNMVNAKPHSYSRGKWPYVICMCDETW